MCLSYSYLEVSIMDKFQVIAAKTMAIITKELQCLLPKRHYSLQVALLSSDLSVGDKTVEIMADTRPAPCRNSPISVRRGRSSLTMER